MKKLFLFAAIAGLGLVSASPPGPKDGPDESEDSAYPPCSRTVTDSCMQGGGHGMRMRRHHGGHGRYHARHHAAHVPAVHAAAAAPAAAAAAATPQERARQQRIRRAGNRG